MTTITRMLLPAPYGPLSAVEVRPDDAAWPPTETAVLVPGTGEAKEDFLPLMQILADAGYRALAIDQRGQHETPGTSDLKAYAVAALAKDLEVAYTAAAARRPVHLVGHGLGGLVAAYACVTAPEMSLSLTLIDCEPESASVAFPETARSALPHAELEECGVPVLVCADTNADEPTPGPCPHLGQPESLAARLTAFWSEPQPGSEPVSIAPQQAKAAVEYGG